MKMANTNSTFFSLVNLLSIAFCFMCTSVVADGESRVHILNALPKDSVELAVQCCGMSGPSCEGKLLNRGEAFVLNVTEESVVEFRCIAIWTDPPSLAWTAYDRKLHMGYSNVFWSLRVKGLYGRWGNTTWTKKADWDRNTPINDD